MTSWAHDPEAAATALIANTFGELELGDNVLVASGNATALRQVLAPREVCHWSRRVAASATVSPDPPACHFTSALMRLPKSRGEQIMTAHQCLGALAATGLLYAYGGNAEGIRTFQKALAALGPVETIATRGHGRILVVRKSDAVGTLKAGFKDWRQELDEPRGWVTYPGLFAAGAADAGTSLLTQFLPTIAEEAEVLDYGCGPGAISAAVLHRQPTARLTLLDNDSIALEAARENVPGADRRLAANLDAAGRSRFDLIVSNPPLHAGFKEDLSPLHSLVANAPSVLKEEGTLLIVVQRRIALDRVLAEAFATVEIAADNGRYRVWRARGAAGPKPRQIALKQLR